MKRAFLSGVFAFVLLAVSPAAEKSFSPVDYVNPFIGTTNFGTTIVYGNPARFIVVQSGARETYIRNIAHTFVRFARGKQIRTRAELYFPRFVQIEQSRAETVNITVAGMQHTVINQQPALGSLDRDRTCTDFGALPCTYLKAAGDITWRWRPQNSISGDSL